MTLRERVSATHILERFVRMSRLLLPSYYTLMNQDELSEKDLRKIERINKVYDAFSASPEASEILVNSNIIELIQNLYSSLKYAGPSNPESHQALESFIHESDRLIRNWNYVVKN